MGEFRGSDAGSPVFAKLQLATTRLTKYRPDAQGDRSSRRRRAARGEGRAPAAPLASAAADRARPAAAMGRQWLALIAGRRRLPRRVRRRLPDRRARPDRSARTPTAARIPRCWQIFAAVAGRAMDGGALYVYLVGDAGNHAYDGVAGHRPRRSRRARRSRGAVPRLVRAAAPPAAAAGDDAWVPPRLEYQFAASAPRARRGREGLRRRRVLRRDGSTGTASTSTPAAALDPVPGSDATGLPPDAPRTMIPVAGVVRRHAEHALVGVRGRPDELRRHRRQHHRPGQAAVPRVRAGLRQRLVRDPVHAAGRRDRCRSAASS